MYELAEFLEDMVRTYHDSSEPEVLNMQCRSTLAGVQEDVHMMMDSMPDQVAFGIYPHIFLTDNGRSFLQKKNIFESTLPSWQSIRVNKYFKINGEGDFIRTLPNINEEKAVKILFSVAYVAEKIKEEMEL